MATRIQGKSRTTKKVMVKATYDVFDGAITYDTIIARKPRLDKKGFPLYGGLPAPVLAEVTVVDSTP
jgi:hypothetical protein